MNRVVKVEVRGLEQVQSAIRMFGKTIAAQVSEAVANTAMNTREDVQRMIRNGPKTGTTYYRIPGKNYMTVRAGGKDGPPVAFIPGGGKQNLSLTHRASRAGEPPANDTGRLLGSIYYRKLDEFTAAIGSPLEYAFILEFGSRNGKIAKRPSWIPAAEKNAVRLEKRIRRVIAEAKARAEGKTR